MSNLALTWFKVNKLLLIRLQPKQIMVWKRGRAGKRKRGQETEHWGLKKARIWYTTDP